MANDGAPMIGLVKALVGHGVLTPEPVGPPSAEGTASDQVQVHVSFAPDELGEALLKTWTDPDGRMHVVVQWKP